MGLWAVVLFLLGILVVGGGLFSAAGALLAGFFAALSDDADSKSYAEIMEEARSLQYWFYGSLAAAGLGCIGVLAGIGLGIATLIS